MNHQPSTINLWVIIPTYNEAENISPLIEQVLERAGKCAHLVHVLVVDDNSPDGTGEVVARLSEQIFRVHVLRRTGKLGYASAVVEGMEEALRHGAVHVLHMDADFSHDPNVIPQMVALISSYDVVIGSRYVEGGGTVNWSGWRRFLSRTANLVARTLLGLPIRDCTSGFRLYRADALQAMRFQDIKVEGYGFLTACTYQCHLSGLRIAEVPITFVDRRFGKSKLSRRVVFEAVCLVLRLALSRLRLKLTKIRPAP